MKDCLKALSSKVNTKNVIKLTAEFPENVTTKSNVIKTDDLRIDLTKNITYPDWVTAKVQANTQAKDHGVKDFIKSGNKGSGSHSGTHKNIIEISFDRKNFDADDFKRQIEQAYKNLREEEEEEDNGEGSSSKKKKSSDKKKDEKKKDEKKKEEKKKGKK